MKRLGIIVALPDEARSLLGRRASVGSVIDRGSGIVVVVGGLGAAAAKRAAGNLADSGVSALMSWGTAGGLDPSLKAGALLLPRAVVDEDGARLAVDSDWHERLRCGLAGDAPIADGDLLTVRTPLVSVAAKCAAYARHRAVAIDMESAAIAEVANARGLPFAVLRVVIDAADRGLPAVVQGALNAAGELRPRAIATALLRRPHEVVELLKVARDFARAERCLKAAAALGGAQAFWVPATPLVHDAPVVT